MEIHDLKIIANQLRIDIVEMIYNAKSGHPGGALGLADIFTVLYFKTLKHYPKKPLNPKRDYVILSNGHVCPVLYASLANSGYFKKEELKTLRQISSRLQGHPHIGSVPGIENTSGPLGQGISQAVGLASTIKRDGKKNLVYCIVGDGELAEGQCWEAIMYAAKEKLDNIVLIVDRNYMQIDGNTKKISALDPLNLKFIAFNWAVIEFDGNNLNQIIKALDEAKKFKEKPVCLIANTMPGKGVSYMQGNYHWHGKVPDENQYIQAMQELNHYKKILENAKKK